MKTLFIIETKAYFEKKDKSLYKNGISWNGSVALDGHYIDE